jgi:hypothetical protein
MPYNPALYSIHPSMYTRSTWQRACRSLLPTRCRNLRTLAVLGMGTESGSTSSTRHGICMEALLNACTQGAGAGVQGSRGTVNLGVRVNYTTQTRQPHACVQRAKRPARHEPNTKRKVQDDDAQECSNCAKRIVTSNGINQEKYIRIAAK